MLCTGNKKKKITFKNYVIINIDFVLLRQKFIYELSSQISMPNINKNDIMKKLIVKQVNISHDGSWSEILKSLEAASWNAIDTMNWPKYSYRPQVQFRMAYCDSAFLLQYRVKEQAVRAVATADNGEVWKDSCVEFFITPADDGIYYNFEFNCAGTCLLSAGASRNGRESAQSALIASIRRQPSLGRHPFGERKGETEWDMALVIPYACLFKHPDYSPSGKIAHANFYKCGDGLTVPHFLSWHPIKTEQPDFHRPEFFGTVKFD